MYAIETINLTKEYNSLALDKLNLQVKQGEVYGFIGRNGAGKTTTINLILSMIHKTDGVIKINDQEVEFSDSLYKSLIGYVPDVPVFPNYMNAKEYITYACDMYSIPKEEIPARVINVLTFVDLKDHKKRIGAYSRGMKQRLAIAQALVHDPDIIIMDEPTSALDPVGRKDVIDIILRLKGKKTIFYSTHILEDAEKVCDRIGLLEQGTLVLEDTIDNIKQMYYQNEMLITTVEPISDVLEFLSKQQIQNNLRQTEEGILCNVHGETTAHDIIELLIKNQFHLVEFKRMNTSLEDVFIEVTNG